MPNSVSAVRRTKARHSSIRTSFSSACVFWRILVGYPSYERSRACALPSPASFHFVMYTVVPAMQLAAHAKSSTLYGRSYVRKSKSFWLDRLLLFLITMERGCARCELRYNITDLVLSFSFRTVVRKGINAGKHVFTELSTL